MNPLLPRYFFMPDAEARVMPDGRLYLYGSQDISGNNEHYCSNEYHVFSTDDPKLEVWKDHGVSLSNTKENAGISYAADELLYAPDGIYRDGTYYLYACGPNNLEAVLESDAPEGPFRNARPIIGADGDGIDPSVFIDDDGQAYLFWGQFRLKGAKLNEDMATLDLDSLTENILTEMEHGFHEGSSIRKRNNKYYMVYTDISRGKATCLAYAMADAPLGPYKKYGVIVDNIFCDAESWNNHGSIAEYHGQWYVFYHRSSQGSCYNRRVCVEPIFFQEDGTIKEVEMTSQGASGPICAFEKIDASIACRTKGNVYIAPEAGYESLDKDVNEILVNGGGGNWIEDWAEYKYINFGDGASKWELRASGKGTVSVMVEDYGVLGTLEVDSKEFVELSGTLTQKAEGVKAVWLLLDGQDISIDWFEFSVL